MALKKYKPTTPSRRWSTYVTSDDITKRKPEKSLVEPLPKKGGRNVYGRVTSRHRGGGAKRMYRIIDFKRDIIDMPATVLTIEYDPNRSTRIALIQYKDNKKNYILAPDGLKVGEEVVSSNNEQIEIKVGNSLPLRLVPLGLTIHNIELRRGCGGKIVRSAGTGASITAKEGGYAHVKLPSGEVRLVDLNCRATIGQLSNVEHGDISFGKAGRIRWLGRRPKVRGVAMNPVDHPHGGGEGKAGQGNPHPVTPWGVATKGYKTRKNKKYSDKYIVKKRV